MVEILTLSSAHTKLKKILAHSPNTLKEAEVRQNSKKKLKSSSFILDTMIWSKKKPSHATVPLNVSWLQPKNI
jgi:hypothetical protein